jgi:hypothetical protein
VEEHYPAAAIVLNNTYMDDILDSVCDEENSKNAMKEVEAVTEKGGFQIIGWTVSQIQVNEQQVNECRIPMHSETEGEKVLGVQWNPKDDYLYFTAKLNFSPKKRKIRTGPNLQVDQIPVGVPVALTKRMVLSQLNSIYDPFGLASPFTIVAKILMRKLWATDVNVGWDDPIPEKLRNEWLEFFRDLFEMEKIQFVRCMKPDGATDPILILFSDGSSNAYGTCAYVRWKMPNGTFECRLIAAKNRLAPLRTITIVRIELCGAVLAKRLRAFIEKETRYKFLACYHIVDSEIVRAMIQKESYGFNTFAATRVGEIQAGTDPLEWYWVDGILNIADWTTRGKKPSELGAKSRWQCGPAFLTSPVEQWPIKRNCTKKDLPETNQVVMLVNSYEKDNLAIRINIGRFSKYMKLLRVTARVLAMYQKKPVLSFKNVNVAPNAEDLRNAELFWFHEAQTSIKQEVDEGKFNRLSPKVNEDGVLVVCGRAERWMEMSYNKQEVILLPYKHPFSCLYAEYEHNHGHLGISATSCKIRSKFWIVNIHRLVKSIRYNCVICKKLQKQTMQQIMSPLPEERLKPSPPWYCTSIDFFGPFITRGEVQRRVRGKAYGVLFNCMTTRAVHVDVADNYSTDGFMKVLRRFISLRGCPAKLYSDGGSQLVAAAKELKNVLKGFELEDLKAFGAEKGMNWEFTPADAPWWNGCAEGLIKSVKKAITTAVGDQVLTPTELQTVCFEAANLVNERPIGRHPQSPEESAYLCPNDLLLGRSTSRVPSGPFKEFANHRRRHEFIQSLVEAFWKKWIRDYFPSLVIRPKWHTSRRNLEPGDIVFIQDSNQVRGNWKLGRVSTFYPDRDGRVRKVAVQYKIPKPNEAPEEYHGSRYVTIERAVQKLILLLPKAE